MNNFNNYQKKLAYNIIKQQNLLYSNFFNSIYKDVYSIPNLYKNNLDNLFNKLDYTPNLDNLLKKLNDTSNFDDLFNKLNYTSNLQDTINKTLKNFSSLIDLNINLPTYKFDITISESISKVLSSLDNYEFLEQMSKLSEYSSKFASVKPITISNSEKTATQLSQFINSHYGDEYNSIENFINDNSELVANIIELYNLNNYNENSVDDKNPETPKKIEVDWKFIIGSIIIPFLLFILQIYISEDKPSIEIHNNYNIEVKSDISDENIEKIIEELQQLKNQEKQQNQTNHNLTHNK